ncbi:hypothetical protein BGW42_002150 [Actinomortierella wolfii]|nr:hypothetical protein BGW42_002150 [Actinomortierella wolfii]
MDRLLTTDNLEQHTQHHKNLNIKRDFVQEYLDALLPWEHVPGTPFVDQSELEARVKEQPLQSPSSKQKHNSSNHRHSQHQNTHKPQDHKRQSSASHQQQPLNSLVKEQHAEANEPTGSKRLKNEVSPIVTPKTDMKQPLPNTGAKSVDQKDDSPKTRRKKETNRAKQEEQKSKRRRKQASQNDTELDVVAHEIRQLDVKSNIKKPAANGRQKDMTHEGPITRSRSAVQGHKNLRTHKTVATSKPSEADWKID